MLAIREGCSVNDLGGLWFLQGHLSFKLLPSLPNPVVLEEGLHVSSFCHSSGLRAIRKKFILCLKLSKSRKC